MGAYRQHAQSGGKLRTVLELGCGPANHAIQLAKRGVQAWALDANPHMLQYAAQKAAAAGVSGVSGLTTVQGDMTNYTIKVRAVTVQVFWGGLTGSAVQPGLSFVVVLLSAWGGA